MSIRRSLSFLVLSVLVAPRAQAEDSKKFTLDPETKALFLGDSITHAGQYITFVETNLRLAHPEAKVDLLNLGLPSETTSGLSEPAHPFPRPNVHERLDRALAKVQPKLVVACYGVNDGIYHPFSEERFDAYKKGIGKLIDKVEKAGAKLVLMTPPPFDPLPMKRQKKLRGRDAKDFAWFGIYANYDEEVMAKYAAWILSQEKRVDLVVDLRTPVLAYVEERRKTNPNFALSGDGIHLDAVGHRVLSQAVSKALGIPQPPPATAKIENKQPVEARVRSPAPKELVRAIQKRQQLRRDAWLSHVGHKRPGVRKGLPIDQAKVRAAKLDAEIRKLVAAAKAK